MIALLLLLLQAQAEPPKPAAPQEDPTDPEVERKTFKVADGWEVTLWAADPLLAKPIQMNWDPKGRLWVSTSTTYPMVVPGEKPDDKILVLEDVDGDGKAEKASVFARGLFIPTGLEVGDGGAYVANATELLHLKDTDGDGQADQRRVLLSGFGTEDTHHIIHTFRWGPDGDFYFNQSIYIHSHIETPHGPRRLGGAGYWRFRPATLELDVLAKGLCNPWGHTIDKWGQSFGTDGAGSEGIHFLVPGAMYTHFPTGERLLTGLSQGRPKYCAHEILSGRHVPDDHQGHFLANDFRANRIARYAVTEEGSGYSAKPMPDFMKSTDRAFRPVDIRMGPDGAVYVADWYNPIINHGEVGFRDARRDKTHGRIWRFAAKDRPLVARPKLDVPTAQLLERLKDPEDWTRHQAKRVLAERDPKDVLPALDAWWPALTDEQTKLEALWTYQSLRASKPELLAALLEAKDGRVRAAAVRAASRLPGTTLAMLAPRAVDEHPRVRLEAVRALRALETPEAFAAALKALDHPTDRFLDYALWLTAWETRAVWQPAVDSSRLTLEPKHLDFALQAVKSPLVAERLVDQVGAGWQSAEQRERALQMLVGSADAGGLGKLFGKNFDGDWQVKVLEALGRASRERGVKPQADLGRVRRFIDHADPRVKDAAMVLAGLWKLESLRPVLEEAATAGRKAGVDGLVALGGDASVAFLKKLGGAAGVAGLAALDPATAAALAGDALASDAERVVAAFLARKGGAEALAAALDPKKVPADAARLALRHMYAAGRQDPALAAVFNAALGLAPARADLAPDALKALAARAVAAGDPARGELVFRRKDLSCFQCHAIAGAGGAVGPDLLSLGASAPSDYILESVLKPDAKTKEGFVSIQVMTKSGDVLSGVRVRETNEELVLREALRDEVTLRKSSIEAQKQIGSVMPRGLADLLTEKELFDLTRFLTELGKPGAYAVPNAPVVRRWRVLEGGLWLPAYATVGGELPAGAHTAARADVDVTTAGKFRIKLGNPDNLTLRIDGKPVEAAVEVNVELERGAHVIELGVEGRTSPLRCEIEEAPGSSGRLRILTGR
ncbi:MAG TPA: PVC-type heme-binding CxxCH protein [Planctomycetota bacterium]